MSAAARRTAIRVLQLGQTPIFEQLQIEEALFRADTGNWCVLNRGVSPPTIVMGISGQARALVNCDAARHRAVPVVRRFTGGGTVVTDSGTVLVSFICNRDAVPERPAYPRELMEWSEQFYRPVFDSVLARDRGDHCSKEAAASRPAQAAGASLFSLRENDYCLGDTKFGGNAQSLSAGRWVHHTSFLWSFTPENLALLSLPAKRPAYRADRPHDAFLTQLRTHVPGGERLDDADGAALLHAAVVARLHEVFVGVEAVAPIDTKAAVARSERRSNAFVEY